MEDRNKRSNPKPDHVKNPVNTTSAPTDPFRAPMRGDMNMPSPTTQTEEASAKPYEGQMREHERRENPRPFGEPTRSSNQPSGAHHSPASSKHSMPGDDHNDPIVPTDQDVEVPPHIRKGEHGEYAPKGGSKAIGNKNLDGSPE
jgi:hypothetical protein